MLFQEPKIPLVYLSPPRSYAGRYAIVAPRVGESMGVLLRQVRQLPGYKLLWLGAPASVMEIRARVWVMYQPSPNGFQLESNGYMNYRDPRDPEKGLGSARQSFASAIVLLSKLTGDVPEEVVVISVL